MEAGDENIFVVRKNEARDMHTCGKTIVQKMQVHVPAAIQDFWCAKVFFRSNFFGGE